MPEIALGNILISRVVKTHIAAGGVDKTIPNNHPSHVAYDTGTHKLDTGTVDLEKTCWNSTDRKWPVAGVLYLLSNCLLGFLPTHWQWTLLSFMHITYRFISGKNLMAWKGRPPPMSLSEDKTGVKLIIIYYWVSFLKAGIAGIDERWLSSLFQMSEATHENVWTSSLQFFMCKLTRKRKIKMIVSALTVE